jgi:hypothetical protein
VNVRNSLGPADGLDSEGSVSDFTGQSTLSESRFAHGGESAESIVIQVPGEIAVTSLAEVIKGSRIASDVRSILRTRKQLASFVRKLDDYLTGMLIAPGGTPLLRDAVESALRMYMLGHPSDRKSETARFMGAALASASAGILGYRVSAVRAEESFIWRPHEDGPIRAFITSTRATALRFDLRHPPELAEQRAMRQVVAREVCRFEDIVAMELGGVDYCKFSF